MRSSSRASAALRRGPARQIDAMICIAITAEDFDAIAAPLGSLAYEAERNAKGEALASPRTDLPLKRARCAFR